MVCKFCGNEIDNNSDFCFICGQKVEPQQPTYAAEPVANVYSQPEAAPAAPVAAAPEAVQAAAPVYAAPAAPVYAADPSVAPVAAPAAPQIKSRKELKKEKKLAKKAAAAACPVTKAQKFFSFVFALVGLILYSKAKKANETEKAVIILNTMMTGLCVKMGIAIIVMIKKFML